MAQVLPHGEVWPPLFGRRVPDVADVCKLCGVNAVRLRHGIFHQSFGSWCSYHVCLILTHRHRVRIRVIITVKFYTASTFLFRVYDTPYNISMATLGSVRVTDLVRYHWRLPNDWSRIKLTQLGRHTLNTSKGRRQNSANNGVRSICAMQMMETGPWCRRH